MSTDREPITIIWDRHYQPGVTSSFHGDMALAFKAMLSDRDLCGHDRSRIEQSIAIHSRMERQPEHDGRRWFNESFGFGDR